MANDEPVLPPVYSTTRIPGRNAPRRSRAFDHGERHPVLIRPGWIEVFELHEDIGRTARNEPLQMHERRAADCAKHRITAAGNEIIEVDYSTMTQV